MLKLKIPPVTMVDQVKVSEIITKAEQDQYASSRSIARGISIYQHTD